MELNASSATTVAALFGFIFGAGLAVPAYAHESDDVSGYSVAGDSTFPHGERIEAAGHNPYEAVALAANDISLTLKVRSVLRRDKITAQGDIRVDTAAAVVTLCGIVPSAAIAARAEQLARSTEGVRDVVNYLQVRRVSD